ncbi:MAG: peptidoglycan-associated lipoprotein Pal [Desulfuromonadaceae bacterium]|nr:peptidoglycan-associated lipoprotein Pal [Desulfuromonadaceae bacterium]
MKKTMITLLASISMFALLTAGCANKEAVKKEEAVVPPVAVEKAEPTKAVEQTQPVEETAPVQDAVVSAVAPQDTQSPVAENRFEAVYFDFDKSDLRQDSRDVLSKNADVILKSLPNAKIQIEGHTDERGSAEYNLALGEHRAKSAQKYLITLGVKAENLSVISYGEEKPAVSGSDEGAWAKNRRAEFVVVK